jgi:hypothetical protein
VHAYVQSRPEYVRYFGRVYIPDELFFHTLLLNSALRDRVVDDDLRYVDWSRPSAGQKTLGIEDIDALEASPKLFARKFDSERDARVLDLVDERLLKRPGSRVAAARVGSPRA